MRSKKCWIGVALVLVMLLLTVGALAQTGTTTVRGTVVDQQEGVIAKAKVTLTNVETKQIRTQDSSGTGTFVFDFIQPGDYELAVEAPGFKRLTIAVSALIARPVELKAQLQVGARNEVVEVTAANSNVAVNTSDSALGNNFEFSQITQLPMEARNVVTLLSLQPAVTTAPNYEGYVAGARSDQSNVTLDGVNINDAESNSITGPVLRLNSEAIEEFRVATTSANASAGRSSGAQIELVTKRGTNQFKGSLFEYHRSIGTANNYFNNIAGVPNPRLLRNTFGAALGGPIKKEKVFFFYSYEGRRDASARTVAQTVPTASLGQGNIIFPNSTGGMTTLTPDDLLTIFPESGGVNPAALQALSDAAAKYPVNDYTTGDSLPGQLMNTGGFRFNSPRPVTLNSHIAKLDFNLTANQTAFVRVNDIHDHQAAASKRFPDVQQSQLWNHPFGIAAVHTWTINNNLVNNFRYGLTRDAFSETGDLEGNDVWFRFVFAPFDGSRTQSRVTPVHNFVDDLSWMKGNHTFQFGGYITAVSNGRTSYGGAWDNAVTNPSYYAINMVVNSVDNYLQSRYGYSIGSGSSADVENAITAVMGRYTQYTANFNFAADGTPMSPGTPSERKFNTQGYEGYFQDIWKLRPNLTLTAGLRYSLWRPVYETHGYEVTPEVPLGEYWNRRVQGMQSGNPYVEPIVLNLSGPANGGPPMYPWDKKVFLPRVALAWSPGYSDGFLRSLFGGPGKSVLRGGFSLANDYFGQALATFFDTRNTLGFSSSYTNEAALFNLGCGGYVVLTGCETNLGPLFTGYGQEIRNFPNIEVPPSLVFPQQKPELRYPGLIEESIDSKLVTPRNYVFSFTFERELTRGALFQVSYLGRLGRRLLAQRDVATPGNLVDPQSGMDWYTAATTLEKLRQLGTPVDQVPSMPYFENLWDVARINAAWCPDENPNCYVNATQAVYDDALNYWGNDWTDIQLDIDRLSRIPVAPGMRYSHAFFTPQYGALAVWSTVANSNYHALAASMRVRARGLTMDFNYTWSHSLDDASGLQSDAGYSSAALILNPLRQRDNYSHSDFDIRHMININSVWQMPFGKGKAIAGGAGGVLDGVIGGWQLSNIFRWNTGTPLYPPFDDARWATNFQVQSGATPIRPVPVNGCPTRGSQPKLFGGCDLTAIYQSFRNAYPGETGPRNIYRLPGYVDLDVGLGKSWKMPYNEAHELQFRWEVFNVSNTQRFGSIDSSRTGFGIVLDPALTDATPPNNWSNFDAIQGDRRVMQFGLRYSF